MIWAILRGLLWALADEFPLGGRKGPASERKESPWWAARPESASSAAEQPASSAAARHEAAAPAADKVSAPSWWAEPAPPTTPPTIKVETDAGSFIASTTFSGHHVLGVRRIERPREEGESRRRRRASRPAMPGKVAVEPREPAVPVAPATSPVTTGDVAVELREPSMPATDVDLQVGEPVRRQLAEVERTPVEGGAVLIDPSEAPRVAQARRVRSRFRPDDQPGFNTLATTLATRLALAASTCGSSSPSACAPARKGDRA